MPFSRVAIITAVVILAFGCASARQDGSRSRAAAPVEVERTVKEFLNAFERLDWQKFTVAFEDGATVFFPVPEPPRRFTGRSEFEPQFQKVFAAIRASNPGGPPYHQLKPEDLTVEVLADDVALASFHLKNEQRTARRTLVLVRTDNKWLIHHLHASNVPKE
jgi:ketosteroid isomerase-like protein